MGAQPEGIAAPRAQRPLRVLVVDDDAGIRELCGSALRSAGFEVIEARDGREGLARAASDDPDLVVCDLAMPILDGFGLAVALRQNAQTRHLPLVFLTGETEAGTEERAHDVGAIGFFSKPFAPQALSSFVSGALGALTGDCA